MLYIYPCELVVLPVLVGRTEVIGAARLVEPGDQFISFSLSVSAVRPP